MRKTVFWRGVAFCLLLPAAVSAQEIKTETGVVRGATADAVSSWKGIPFAAPPVGQLRWRAPQSPARWAGVRDANQYGADCMQLPFPSDAAPLGVTPAEDCLYLNVWRPSASGARLPVVVWIYGGGFVNGGSSPATYSGANLAKQGVVFVSFNYRVGRFGTFAHPQLTKARQDEPPIGNYGYMDQLAALKWVKRNIAAFGGDPANVTLVGESAGGMSVHALITSPMAVGLFQKAVIMSGGDGAGLADKTLDNVEEVGLRFAASKGIAADDPQALTKLRALSAEQVTDGLNLASNRQEAGPLTHSAPFNDGRLGLDVGAAYARGAFARVPTIIGATSGDIGGRTGYMAAGARRLAGQIADADAPVFAYRFSYSAQSLNRQTASHASDIPYFLDTVSVKYADKTTPLDAQVGHTISRYLVNFASRGDPNGSGLPAWPRYDRRMDEIMDFLPTGQAASRKDPLGPELDAAAAAAPNR